MFRLFINASAALILLLPAGLHAQSGEPMGSFILVPAISGPSDIAVGRTLVLDASASRVPDENIEYRWYRDDIPQSISNSVEAVFTPEESGTTVFRLVISVEREGERIEAEASREVTVYDRKIVLIADSTVADTKLDIHRQQAAEAGIFLRVLQSDTTNIPLTEGVPLTGVIDENASSLGGAEAVVIWTDGVTGLQALMQAFESDPERLALLANQTIVLITDQSVDTIARTARGPFSVLDPSRIVVTRREALTALFANPDDFIAQIDLADIGYSVVDESTTAIRPWNIISSLVNYMLTNGVPSRTILFLLMLPVIATIIAFLKQVIGLTTFGLYTPSVMALSFLALGWTVGIAFLMFILVMGYITRSAMKKWRLLYAPKVAIILTIVSITLLVLLGIGAYFDLTLTGDTIFILLIMSTLSESLLNVKAEQGLYSAIVAVSETILAALLCVFIVQWDILQSAVLAYPELILLTLLINAFLGRWTGLRLFEYFRFREVFKHLQEE